MGGFAGKKKNVSEQQITSAEEVYRRNNYKKTDSSRFFRELITAILADYKKYCRCEYIDSIYAKINGMSFSGNYPSIYVVEYCVISELFSCFVKEQKPRYYSDFPYLPYRDVYYIKEECGYKIQEFDIGVRDMLYQIKKILGNRKYYNNVLTYPINNRLKADDVDAISKDERNRIINGAKDKAELILSDAEKEKNNAQAEVERIVREARDKAEKLLNEAREKAKEYVEADAKKIIDEKLSDYQQTIQNMWLATNVESSSDNEEDYHSIINAKKDLCSETDAMKRSWREEMLTAIEEMRSAQSELESKIKAAHEELGSKMLSAQQEMESKMRNVQTGLETKVRNWQVSLFHHELSALADCYCDTYRIATKNRCLTDSILNEESNGIPPLTLEDLKKLKSSLLVNLKKMENAMKPLGLKVFFPEEGEKFDEIFHEAISNNGLTYENDAVIAECLTPGVSQIGSDEFGDVPIVRAFVKVKAGGTDNNDTL